MKHFLILLLISLGLTANAQLSNTQWSDAVDLDNTQALIGNFCNGSNQTSLLFTNDESSPTTIKLIFVDLETNATIACKYSFPKAVNSIIGGYNKPNSFVILYDLITDNSTGFLYEVKSVEIKKDNSTEDKSIAKFSTANKLFLGKSKFSQSPDLKKTLLFIENPYIQGQKELLNMIVFDENGKEESNNTVSLDLDSKQNVHNYPQISNSGSVFFLKKDKEKNQHRYFIYSFDPTTKDVNHKLIALPNTSITEIKGQVTSQNEFLVAGFTASEPIHVFEGYYLFKFDSHCVQKFKTQGQFDEQTFLRFLSKKEYSKDPVIRDFYIDNIIILETGKIFISAEHYKEENISKDITWANYRDLMFVSFDATGKYKTTFKYQKNQSLVTDHSHWASYETYPNADTLVIAHNYIVKTEGKKVPEPVFTLVNVHEKFGTKTQSTYKLGRQVDTPLFLPDLIYIPNKKQYLCLFSDFNRTKIRLGIFNL